MKDTEFEIKIMAIRAIDELCIDIWGHHVDTSEFDKLWDMNSDELHLTLCELFNFMIMKRGL